MYIVEFGSRGQDRVKRHGGRKEVCQETDCQIIQTENVWPAKLTELRECGAQVPNEICPAVREVCVRSKEVFVPDLYVVKLVGLGVSQGCTECSCKESQVCRLLIKLRNTRTWFALAWVANDEVDLYNGVRTEQLYSKTCSYLIDRLLHVRSNVCSIYGSSKRVAYSI